MKTLVVLGTINSEALYTGSWYKSLLCNNNQNFIQLWCHYVFYVFVSLQQAYW